MQSKATTVAKYLTDLPPDRRQAIQAVREVVRANIDPALEEGMQYGMIGYYVPHRVYPAGYHCDPRQPLPFGGLASQKNHMALYLMSIYLDPEMLAWFTAAWKKTGKKLDMGKSCIRFKRIDDVALDVIAEALRRTPLTKYVQQYESILKRMTSGKPVASSAAKPSSAKKAATKKPVKKPLVAKTAAKKSAKKGAGMKKAVKTMVAKRRVAGRR